MKTLIALALSLFAVTAFAAQTGQAPDPTLNMKRAHKVDPKDVKILPGNKALVVAVLTYGDGSKAKCEFDMDWKSAAKNDRQGFEFLPNGQRCWPIK